LRFTHPPPLPLPSPARAHTNHHQAFPYKLCWNAEAKPDIWPGAAQGASPPLSHIKLIYRVVPASLGVPSNPKEIRAWFVVGSCNLSKAGVRSRVIELLHISEAVNRLMFFFWHHSLSIHTHTPNPSHTQWGDGGTLPSNFELSVLLATNSPQLAASALDTLPLKLPPGGSLTGLEQTVVAADRYPKPNGKHVVYKREKPHAPFNYAFDKAAVFEAARDAVLGGGGALDMEG
jgi:hypothetical protein